MNLVATTERISLYRREDIILSKTFPSLKVDLYMEDIFETVS